MNPIDVGCIVTEKDPAIAIAEEDVEVRLLASLGDAERLAEKLEEGVEDVKPELRELVDYWLCFLPRSHRLEQLARDLLAPRERRSRHRVSRRRGRDRRDLRRLIRRLQRRVETLTEAA